MTMKNFVIKRTFGTKIHPDTAESTPIDSYFQSIELRKIAKKQFALISKLFTSY